MGQREGESLREKNEIRNDTGCHKSDGKTDFKLKTWPRFIDDHNKIQLKSRESPKKVSQISAHNRWISYLSSIKMKLTGNVAIDQKRSDSNFVNRRNCDSDISQRRTVNNLGQNHKRERSRETMGLSLIFSAIIYLLCDLPIGIHDESLGKCCDLKPHLSTIFAEASLIIGDSAIEIQEVDQQQQSPGGNQMPPDLSNTGNILQSQENQNQAQQTHAQHQTQDQTPDIILGSADPSITLGSLGSLGDGPIRNGGIDSDNALRDNPQQQMSGKNEFPAQSSPYRHTNQQPRPSLPSPVAGTGNQRTNNDDITDGDGRSRPDHDFEQNHNSETEHRVDFGEVMPVGEDGNNRDKAITGRVVDFELTPAGGHNKAKIKKKKKKKVEGMEAYKKKWGKKKSEEKKAMEKKEKHSMKKKKEEGKKGKKKWGVEEHGQKKKGKFKKKKWGKKTKKGKGVKKGKKGHKMLKDKGHKSTGFKTVYHKEEYGKSAKWHDIKREKKWDEKAKKWKKKWKKEKGKKYKGEHMKKFEKKKKEGKKYKKEKKDKFKKFKKEKFEKGKKMKKDEYGKKKEGGEKKEMKEMKKKMKKKKKP